MTSTPDPVPASVLPGVRFGRLVRHTDARGSFRELWRASAFGPLDSDATGTPDARFVQANLSASETGVLRGLHYHRRQLDYWVVAGGRAFVALIDVRPFVGRAARSSVGRAARASVGRAATASVGRAASPFMGPAAPPPTPSIETRELAVDDWVVIPAGVGHGFLALEPLELLYLVTNEFDGSDELGFAWDDPAVAVPWPAVSATPDGRPILSDRDRTNPSLAQLLSRLGPG